jgi:type VI protein secretion system component VasK
VKRFPRVRFAAYDRDNAGFTAEIKHYFIKDLFTQVVIPDQNFLREKLLRAHAKQLARLGIMVGLRSAGLVHSGHHFGLSRQPTENGGHGESQPGGAIGEMAR